MKGVYGIRLFWVLITLFNLGFLQAYMILYIDLIDLKFKRIF